MRGNGSNAPHSNHSSVKIVISIKFSMVYFYDLDVSLRLSIHKSISFLSKIERRREYVSKFRRSEIMFSVHQKVGNPAAHFCRACGH